MAPGEAIRHAVTSMQTDFHGVPITAPSAAAVAAYDHVVAGYLSYRADTPKRLEVLLATAPDMPMAQVLKGYLLMLGFKAALLPAVTAARTAAATAMGPEARQVTAREAAHLGALTAWLAGDVTATLDRWEAILAEHPRDVLAFRLHHFVAFWMGEPQRMARMVDHVLPAFGHHEATTAALLACKCFAYEELCRFDVAEPAGREAIARNPGDLWAAHAVAHVLEMQGRRDDGIALLDRLEPHWAGGNNLLHHLWWHRSLYHFERGEFERVLGLYDGAFRNLASPLTTAQPDVYIDIQNAASMLFRLERQGVSVGDRWHELADHAQARIGDCLSAFTLPHWMLALTATRRFEAAGRMLEAMRAFGDGPGTVAPIVRDQALPVCAAILARAQGAPDRALTLMRPALDGMGRLGGSHAQQDVLLQVFLDCALAAGSTADARRVIDHVGKLYTVAPAQRRGYAMA
jgi:tetratricopeptide (TPR) repeat protein